MKPWELLETVEVPGGGRMTLHRRDTEFVIRVAGHDLMSSRMHASEDALADLACENAPAGAHVLIGGLGMGFTLRRALDRLDARARIDVAELVPSVAEWNRTHLRELSGGALSDRRVQLHTRDVAEVIENAKGRYFAILLDVDNGPAAMIRANEGLYGARSLARMHRALVDEGVLAVWSAGESPDFERRLRSAGFAVHRRHVRAREGGGATHVIWLARPKSDMQLRAAADARAEAEANARRRKPRPRAPRS